jgi:hypothetical protein
VPDRESMDKVHSAQPLDPWTEFLVNNNQALITIFNAMVDLGSAWMKITLHEWFTNYYIDLYRKRVEIP